MIATVLPIAVLLGVIGSGLMAGLFFAFSTSVMPALGRMRPAQGAEAMQHVNRVIQNPLFLLVFMGTLARESGSPPGESDVRARRVRHLDTASRARRHASSETRVRRPLR